MDLLYEKESYRIRGAAYEVYREMGHGYVEAVYQECMERELTVSGVPFEARRELVLQYKGQPLEQRYIPDIVCFEAIIVELKAAKTLLPEHRAQVMNYLKGTGTRLGLLVNFRHFPGVEIERIVL